MRSVLFMMMLVGVLYARIIAPTYCAVHSNCGGPHLLLYCLCFANSCASFLLLFLGTVMCCLRICVHYALS